MRLGLQEINVGKMFILWCERARVCFFMQGKQSSLIKFVLMAMLAIFLYYFFLLFLVIWNIVELAYAVMEHIDVSPIVDVSPNYSISAKAMKKLSVVV